MESTAAQVIAHLLIATPAGLNREALAVYGNLDTKDVDTALKALDGMDLYERDGKWVAGPDLLAQLDGRAMPQ